MKRKLKTLLIITILIILILLSATVNAASMTMSLTSESGLISGDIVTVILRISSINTNGGIDIIEGTLNYDKDIFENVTKDSFEGINRWNIMEYNSETGNFIVTRSAKVNMVSDVLKVKLKVKKEIKSNSSIIEIKDIISTGGVNNMGQTQTIKVEEDVKVTINKTSQITLNPDNPDKTNQQLNEQQNNNTQVINNNINNEMIEENPIKNNTENGENIKKQEKYGVIIAITIVTVASVISYIRLNNM